MIKKWFPDILNAVYEASEAIMNVYEGNFEVTYKTDDSPVTLADKQSNMILTTALEKTGVLIVSEEDEKPNYQKRKDQAIWLVDPLDGTKEFVNRNDEFCICIALIEDHQPSFGLIAAPVTKEIIFGGIDIPPALIKYGEKNHFDRIHQLSPVQDKMVKNIIYSRTHYTPNIDILVERIEVEHGTVGRILKGSAMKFFDLVTDRAQIYPRLWPTMEWDIAAGHAIYKALGGEVFEFSTFEPLSYNKESLYNPKFIAKPKNLKIK